MAIMAPLVVLTIFFGFYPAPILNMTSTAVNAVVARTDTVAAAVKTASLLFSF
jgi:NADH-quinone oxidoreductase subunit M